MSGIYVDTGVRSVGHHTVDSRYKKLCFPSVIVQQILYATRAIFRHNRL